MKRPFDRSTLDIYEMQTLQRRRRSENTMRLRKSRPQSDEELLAQINAGYRLLNDSRADYRAKYPDKGFDSALDNERFDSAINAWAEEVVGSLTEMFPTELEVNEFLEHERQWASRVLGADPKWTHLTRRLEELIRNLKAIRDKRLPNYTDLPISTRLYVESIDSFQKVRDVNPAEVADRLNRGYLDRSEDEVQIGLEAILDVPFHRKDWGGETADLYTSNVVVNGSRFASAFLLKGNGLRKNVMELRDCGKNGDQILRLFTVPALLFVVQFVGEVSENVINDVEGKVNQLRAGGRPACYCIMNGQDTARVLRAYGKL